MHRDITDGLIAANDDRAGVRHVDDMPGEVVDEVLRWTRAAAGGAVVMGNVFVHTMTSLDGFIAGPNDDMSWVFRHVDDMPGKVVDEVIGRTGAVLAGRRVYEVGRRVQRPEARGLFDGRWRGPHLILTHVPPTDETDPIFRFLSGDVRDAVTTALTAAGGRDVLLLGANVSTGQTLLISASRRGSSMRSSCTSCRSSSGGRGAVVRCLDASCFAHDARRVGIRSGREPAIAS